MLLLGSHSDASLQSNSVCPDRKLKKLVRELKNKGAAETTKEEERPPQQWNLDYALAPFEGLTPEYMEMSEFARAHVCEHVHELGRGKAAPRAQRVCPRFTV